MTVAVGVLSSSEAQAAAVDPDSVDNGSATTQALRDRWRKAEARTELFERNSLMWREGREGGHDAPPGHATVFCAPAEEGRGQKPPTRAPLARATHRTPCPPTRWTPLRVAL